MSNKYIFIDGDDSFRLRNLERTLDDRNYAVLTWEWPQNRLAKLLFIFEWTDGDPPNIEILFGENYPHAVCSRELPPRYTKNIHGKSKFVVATGYFDEQKRITIVKPAEQTDWLFKKVNLNASAQIKPVPLGQFQKATLRVTSDDPSQMERITEILTYAIYEQGQKVGEYPIDAQICAGTCSVYVKKSQTIKFILDENYTHLYKLIQR